MAGSTSSLSSKWLRRSLSSSCTSLPGSTPCVALSKPTVRVFARLYSILLCLPIISCISNLTLRQARNMRYAFFTFRNVDDSQCVEWCRVCSSVKGGRVTHCLRAKIDCQGAHWCRLLSLIAWLQQCQGVPSHLRPRSCPAPAVMVATRRKDTGYDRIQVYRVQCTGSFLGVVFPDETGAGADGFVEYCQETTACNNEVYLLAKQLDEQEARLHLPVLGAMLTVFPQEHLVHILLSRLKALSRVAMMNADGVIHSRICRAVKWLAGVFRQFWCSCVQRAALLPSCLSSTSLFPQRVTSTSSLRKLLFRTRVLRT